MLNWFFGEGYGVEPAFNLPYDDVTCMWHHIPYGGINMIGAVENLMHTTPFGVTRPSQSHPNQMCLCETCVFDSRNSAKQLKTSTILNPSIGLGVGEIKTFFKQGLTQLIACWELDAPLSVNNESRSESGPSSESY
ncbi:hypothetical protein Bhyg_10305 [Pseudolycoriella hygida]|uniref:Uncharacterized protein n=1 Tax=Pseudolycoriella hygida TaxID=35572 RepID=A0A9Q0MTQ1_9DIPT|nr:hypothetical protein Bhyg_10305 [Pseudolycoriella hygida]